MRKNPFLDTMHLDIDKTLADFQVFATRDLKRLGREAKKALRAAESFSLDPLATYVLKDAKPQEFLGEPFLLIEAVDGDVGERPLTHRPRRCVGLAIARENGEPVDGLSMSTTYEVTCLARNLGDLDVYNATVEFFLGSAALHPHSGPFRMTVKEVFSIAGRGIVAVGIVERGSITAGQEILIQTDAGEVQTLAIGLQRGSSAHAGEEVGILLRGIRRDQAPSGAVILRVDQLGQLAADPSVPEVEFLGNATVSLPAFSSAEARLSFTTASVSRPRQAMIFARVYSQAPEQLPQDFNTLDCQVSRLVAQLTIG